MTIKNNYTRLLITAVLIILDIYIFSSLFFPKLKSIVTPEFYGGDTTVVYMPYKYYSCDKVKELSQPFWSKNMGSGYPLYSEGEIGFFNPVNLLTCFLFDYKTAFNLQIVIYTLIGQIGMYLLIRQLKLSRLTAIFIAFVFPFLPIYVMNYMQILLVYPLFIIPFILAGVFKLSEKLSIGNFLFLFVAVFFQFIVSHYQIFFMTFVLTLVLIIYLLLKQKIKNKKKFILVCLLSYLAGVTAAGFQLIPMLEFFIQSNRSMVNNTPMAVLFDQNLNFANLATLLSPYFFGRPQTASYQFSGQAHPWEATFFIYYLPLVFLILAFFKFKNITKKHLVFFVLGFLIILLLSLGRNSPFYLVHYLPFFSAFRFPSRYVLISVMLLLIIAGYGFEKAIGYFKNSYVRYAFFLVMLLITALEINNFFRSFHVLIDADKLYLPPMVLKQMNLSGQTKYITPQSDVSWMDRQYIEKGYSKQPYFYYNFANELLLGNTNLVYKIESLNNKAGPQLKRMSYYYSYLFNEESDWKNKTASFSAQAKNLLAYSGTDYVVSSFQYKNDFLELKKKFHNREYNFDINLYKNKLSKSAVQFFSQAKLIETLEDFEKHISSADEGVLDFALVEDRLLVNKLNNKDVSIKDNKFKIIKNTDDRLLLVTVTANDSLLVSANNYYPGWHAYIDGREQPLSIVNFINKGVFLPAGMHTVEFRYIAYSFYIGLIISVVSLILLTAILFRLSRASVKRSS